jgi:hypothetical protein
MDEPHVRALVRDAVARHLSTAERPAARPREVSAALHASHGQYLDLVNGTDACLIEATVLCNHCGYCKSHGY